MGKLIITAALTGAETTRADNPNLPLTPEEIARAAAEAAEAGASIIHLHVRDAEGKPTQDVDVFRKTTSLIRKSCDCIVQFSTGGAVGTPPEERLRPLDLVPEMATLTCGTVNFGDAVFENPPRLIEALARKMAELGVKPELEIFDVGMVATAMNLAKRGLVGEPMYFDFVMGVPGGIPGTIDNLMHLVRQIPAGSLWQVAGVGRAELPLAVVAVVAGGHVRVGFEDNVYYSKGVLARSNAELVARVARIAREVGRDVASPAEARQMLGIAPVPG
ncbi:MAG: 3-keto-5-aminohexanoate cleavage protein [Firmicutes bacterium]|nr:3-keto-5-aminohexanoate cleavage protein [Bacillota bacterium]MDH7496462.1 3-keto-5-aminohexanoate cleavage protein [Bacillota bacterium]